MSYYDLLMAVVNRPLSVVGHLSSVNNFLYTTFPPKLLGGLSQIFIGMILGQSPFKVVQGISFHTEFWLPWQPKEKLKKSSGQKLHAMVRFQNNLVQMVLG